MSKQAIRTKGNTYLNNDIIDQTLLIESTDIYENIILMPDVHVGKGCVIGFTALINTNIGICPNAIGSDIGCGVVASKLNRKLSDAELAEFDTKVRKAIPLGTQCGQPISKSTIHTYDEISRIEKLIHLIDCLYGHTIKGKDKINNQLGTLGSGNHFIELAKSKNSNDHWIIVHTGSRNIGFSIWQFYQNCADTYSNNKDIAYISSKDTIAEYIQASKYMNQWAIYNRDIIIRSIHNLFGTKEVDRIESIHNYIEEYRGNMYIRKGAISAYKDQKIIIPMNMAFGSIIGIGQGNKDWNFSAPHGAGRKLSRSEGKNSISLDEFQRVMKNANVVNTSMKTCIDEAPQNYKEPYEIIKAIDPETVSIDDILYPIINIKG